MSRVEFVAPVRREGAEVTGLIGLGVVLPEAGGLRVSGKIGKTGVPTAVGVVTGVVCTVLAVIVMVSVGLDRTLGGRSGMKLIALIAIVAGAVPGWLVFHALLSNLPGTPVDVLVPWASVRAIHCEPHRVELTLTAPTLRGDVAFVPSPEDVEKLIHAIRSH